MDVAEAIRDVCRQIVKANPARLRVAMNEEDESPTPQPEAHEFLKLDEKRLGRDFKLYGLMATVNDDNLAHPLADFAAVLMAVMSNVPEAFEAVRSTVEGWSEHFPTEHQPGWIDLWAKAQPSARG